MACCKCCCGNQDCSEGQQGKCCCGGSTGTCCDTGEYCCSGTCQAEPCGCQDNADCGCETAGYTYYPEAEAAFPGLGCCRDGAYYEDGHGCWEGTAGTESAMEPNLCCCDGVCDTCPTVCVYQALDDCDNEIWTWSTGVEQSECESFFNGTWYRGTELVNIPSYTYDNSYECNDPQTFPSQDIDPCTGAVALGLNVKVLQGPGTELKALLAKIGIVASPGCSCNKRADVMNRNGIHWCEQNVETICDWLQEEATKRKLPFVRLAGKALIHLAIRRAKKGNNK